jgi:hypothetical protein
LQHQLPLIYLPPNEMGRETQKEQAKLYGLSNLVSKLLGFDHYDELLLVVVLLQGPLADAVCSPYHRP